MIFIAVNCLAKAKQKRWRKKWHSKSCSRFGLIKMTLFKEHDCIYLHNRNHSGNSCNAVQQAYVSSRQAGRRLTWDLSTKCLNFIENYSRWLYASGVRVCSFSFGCVWVWVFVWILIIIVRHVMQFDRLSSEQEITICAESINFD